jgi:hypothetical protein
MYSSGNVTSLRRDMYDKRSTRQGTWTLTKREYDRFLKRGKGIIVKNSHDEYMQLSHDQLLLAWNAGISFVSKDGVNIRSMPFVESYL